MPKTPAPLYSERLDEALVLAAGAFRMHVRKGGNIPYLTHLLQVLVTVGEHGGDEDQMIAAVLHDYLEDIETATTAELRARFGERVTDFVEALSDSTHSPKPPWKKRKQDYLVHLRNESSDLKLISAADKLHNANSIERDLKTVGEALWERFTAGQEETLWYYRELVNALGHGWAHPLVGELRQVVGRIHQQVGVPWAGMSESSLKSAKQIE